MTHNFEIYISGISLCFYKEPYWNVIFPCDATHRARFCWPEGGAEMEVSDGNRLLLVEVPIEAVPKPAPVYQASVVSLFNMSASYAHDVNSSGASNLKLNDLEKRNDAFVWLRVPNATMDQQVAAPCSYYVQNAKSVGLPPIILGHPIARRAVLKFMIAGGIDLMAEDLRSPAPPKPIARFPIPATTHVIGIDNDCWTGCAEENDFLNLYRIVTDVNNKQIVAGQIKCGAEQPYPGLCASHAEIEDKAHSAAASAWKLFVTSYGNCDPTISEPPPGD